jgi:hypothetical protein
MGTQRGTENEALCVSARLLTRHSAGLTIVNTTNVTTEVPSASEARGNQSANARTKAPASRVA